MAAPMDKVAEHHKQKGICASRPSYRQGRRDRAVKVYTVNQESRYLLVQGVPAIGVSEDLVRRFALYGAVQEYRILHEYPAEEFTQVYWVKFDRLQAARIAKRKLDDHSFFGGVLHVSYAPEFETVDDTREKLGERRRLIANKTRRNEQSVKQQHVSVQHPGQVQASTSKSTLQTELSHGTNYQVETNRPPPNDTDSECFPALPPPPQYQWCNPVQQQRPWDIPKVGTKQGAFPVDYDARLTVQNPVTNQPTPYNKIPSNNQTAENSGPLIGPQLPPKHQSGDDKEEGGGAIGQGVVPDLVPRQVLAGRKRPAPPGFFGEALDGDKDSERKDDDQDNDEQQTTPHPDTGSSSLNRTARFVRQKMMQISQTRTKLSSGSRSSMSGSSSSSSGSSKATTRRRI